MQPQNSNQYDFILDPSQQQRPGMSGGGPAFLQDPVKRLVAAVVFVFVVLMIVFIGISILFSGGGGSSKLEEVAGVQSEIVRIANQGLLEARDPATRADVATILTFTKSDLSATSGYLGGFDEKKAALYINPELDELLQRAAERNVYDDAILEILGDLGADYKAALQDALDSSSGEEETLILETAAVNILTFEGE